MERKKIDVWWLHGRVNYFNISNKGILRRGSWQKGARVSCYERSLQPSNFPDRCSLELTLA